MIINHSKTLKAITSWIADYIHKNGKNALVINFLPYDSLSVATTFICLETNIHTNCVTFTNDKDVCSVVSSMLELSLNAKTYHSPADNLIYEMAHPALAHFSHFEKNSNDYLREAIPVVIQRYIASKTNGVVIGQQSKERYSTRCFKKDSIGDILPFADLYSDEIIELFYELPTAKNNKNFQKYKDVISLQPAFDFCTDDELIWASKEDRINNIISSDKDPTKERSWQRYTLKQRQCIAKLNQIEKLSRHKQNDNIPICSLRDKEGLVK